MLTLHAADIGRGVRSVMTPAKRIAAMVLGFMAHLLSPLTLGGATRMPSAQLFDGTWLCHVRKNRRTGGPFSAAGNSAVQSRLAFFARRSAVTRIFPSLPTESASMAIVPISRDFYRQHRGHLLSAPTTISPPSDAEKRALVFM